MLESETRFYEIIYLPPDMKFDTHCYDFCIPDPNGDVYGGAESKTMISARAALIDCIKRRINDIL